MISPECTVAKAKDTPWNVIDDEAVLLNLDTGCYYILNETGCRVWELLDGEHCVKALADQICQEYEVDTAQALQDVIAILEKLQQEKLIDLIEKKEPSLA